MSDPKEPAPTHRVNIACGYPADPYAIPRFVMGESFDAAMTLTIPAVPASEDGKALEVPEKQVRIFSAKEISAAVEKGWLIELATEKKVAHPKAETFQASTKSDETPKT